MKCWFNIRILGHDAVTNVMKVTKENLNVVTAKSVAVIADMRSSTILRSVRMAMGYSSSRQIMSG